MPDYRERVLGMLLGGAIGDASGGAVERGVAEISDDTQLTLATCEAILAAGGADAQRIANQMLAWFRRGAVTGLGSSTLKALRDLDAGVHWALAGARGERAAGNGAAMRVAPLACCLNPSLPADRTLLRDICRITHHSDEAYAGALATLSALRRALSGTWRREALGEIAANLPDTRIRDRLQEILAVSPAMPVADIAARFGTSGYVVESVPLALFAAAEIESDGFDGGLARLLACGGDADTIAAIACQIAGAARGAQSLPMDRLTALPAEVRTIVQAFADRMRPA